MKYNFSNLDALESLFKVANQEEMSNRQKLEICVMIPQFFQSRKYLIMYNEGANKYGDALLH